MPLTIVLLTMHGWLILINMGAEKAVFMTNKGIIDALVIAQYRKNVNSG